MLAPFVESVGSELQRLVALRLDEALRPLREEPSTIKLWLACLATHLVESVEPLGDHTLVSHMVELFRPLFSCSPFSDTFGP